MENWFTNSLLPPIATEVGMGGVVTEEKVIIHAQYLDLVYSQYGTLYDMIPHDPRPPNDSSKPSSGAHVDGMVGSIKLQSVTQSTGKQGYTTSTPTSSQTGANTKYAPSLSQTFEVNAVQSPSSQQSRGKKKKRVNPKNILTSRRVQTPKIPMLGEKKEGR
jgi:hypothetical protein